MPRLSVALSTARTSANLSEPLMAKMVGSDVARLRRLEAGTSEPTPDELEAYAQVFGVGLRQLAAGDAVRAPLTHMFYRSVSEGGPEALDELIATGAHRVLGEFMRCVRDIAEMEELLRLPKPPALPAPPARLTDLGAAPPHGGDQLADWLRAELGLGLAPILSMRDLITKRLGVRALWVTVEQLSAMIDGASTLFPRPAILVNLVEGPLCWWRTRMTLAHELCHLLCDREPGDERFTIFSPHGPTHGGRSLFRGFDRIERRAGAFAACFLAPAEAVRRAVASHDVTSEDAIATIGQEFGLGRTAAINRLQQVFGLSKQTRQGMEARSANHWPRWIRSDRAPREVGLRGGEVKQLALQAFALGRLDAVEVRRYLSLPLTEPLPEFEGLSTEQRAPLRRVEDTVRGIAQRHLQEEEIDADECVATAVRRTPQGFEVDVERRGEDTSEPPVVCGKVDVSHERVVVGARIEARAERAARHGV